MQPVIDPIRKAAILLSTLEQDVADGLLEQMEPVQAARVRRALIDLGDIDALEQDAVIDEFLRIGPLPPPTDVSGVELDLHHDQRPAIAPDRADLYRRAAAAPQLDDPPFQFLHAANSAKLTPFLKDEHPQTIALVISHLPPEQAVGVLSGLQPPVQAEVIRRLVNLDETNPEILREVERGLESRITAHARLEHRKAAGLSLVARILETADDRVAQEIVRNLARHEPRLANKLQLHPPTLDFEDLTALDSAALAMVFQTAGPELSVMALAGADAELVDQLLRHLPPHDARALSQSLDHLGPTRLSDLAQARNELAAIAQQLAAAGRVYVPRRLPAAA